MKEKPCGVQNSPSGGQGSRGELAHWFGLEVELPGDFTRPQVTEGVGVPRSSFLPLGVPGEWCGRGDKKQRAAGARGKVWGDHEASPSPREVCELCGPVSHRSLPMGPAALLMTCWLIRWERAT